MAFKVLRSLALLVGIHGISDLEFPFPSHTLLGCVLELEKEALFTSQPKIGNELSMIWGWGPDLGMGWRQTQGHTAHTRR